MRQVRMIPTAPADLERARKALPQPAPYYPTLMKVTAASAIAGQDKRWLYTVVEATVDSTSSYVPTVSVNTGSYSALSVSELSNIGSFVSYGVLKTSIPAGFSAKAIPIGTNVLCVPYWRSDSSSIYLIINTQAIDGTCAGGLTDDYDFGLMLQPTDEDLEGGFLDAPEGDYDWGGITYDDYGQFYDDLNLLDQQTFASPVTATTDYGTY